MQKQENEAERLKIELDSLKKEERDRQKKIDKLAKELKEWQHELDNPPVKENTAELEEMRASYHLYESICIADITIVFTESQD